MKEHQKYRDLRVILSMLRIMDRFAEKREDSGHHPIMIEPEPNLFMLRSLEIEQANFGIRDHKRLTFNAEVRLISDEHELVGHVDNISSTGIFVTCKPEIFTPPDKIRMEITPEGSKESYSTVGTVVRVGDDPVWPQGIGLKFSTFQEER